MQIFNKLLAKDDFKAFLDLTRENKISWIKKHTNQQNEALINDFLDNPHKEVDGCCVGCGNNHKKNESISKANVIEVADSSTEIVVAEPSEGNSIERPKESKRRKNK
jgi:hypothetical protein